MLGGDSFYRIILDPWRLDSVTGGRIEGTRFSPHSPFVSKKQSRLRPKHKPWVKCPGESKLRLIYPSAFTRNRVQQQVLINYRIEGFLINFANMPTTHFSR